MKKKAKGNQRRRGGESDGGVFFATSAPALPSESKCRRLKDDEDGAKREEAERGGGEGGGEEGGGGEGGGKEGGGKDVKWEQKVIEIGQSGSERGLEAMFGGLGRKRGVQL